jgi:hypothetical protein
VTGSCNDPAAVGFAAAGQLLDRGAGDILADVRRA